jgi:hypothetical protein
VEALRHGLAVALFSGHGTPQGWLAYGGVDHRILLDGMPWSVSETIGLLFSLSCKTAARSFAHALVTDGIAGAVFAPTSDILHVHNQQIAQAIIESLDRGAVTLSEIVLAARTKVSLRGYTICGDPALRAVATQQALQKAKDVFAPAPDFDLLLASSRRHVQSTSFQSEKDQTHI